MLKSDKITKLLNEIKIIFCTKKKMTLSYLDWAIIAVYFIVSLAIGLYYKNRSKQSLNDFFLGGRNLPWHVAGVSMVATTFAADTPLAVTELVGQYGISGNWLWWNMLLGGMLTTFFFAKLWRRANILTEVEFIEFRYRGKAAAILRGFKSLYLGLFMNILIMGWVNVALMSILQVFFDIPKSEVIWYVAGAMVITAIYSAISGLWGVAITDVIQFVIAMTGCIVLAYIVLNSAQIGGIDGLKAKLPAWQFDFFPKIGRSGNAGIASTLALSVGTFLAYLSIWAFSWYPGAEPGGGGYIAQRMMSAKTERDSLYATLFFQVAHYCLRPWPWIIVALCASALYPDLSYADKKLGYVYVMKDFLPIGLKGLLIVAFLAAYMSTISTQLNWGASYLVNDFYKRFILSKSVKNNDEKHLVLVSKFVTIITMTLSLYVTTKIESISQVWSFIIECGAGLGLVLILRWYWWRINAWSEITATIAPIISYACCKYIFGITDFATSFFTTVSFTTIAWIIVTFLTKPEQDTTLKEFYDRVQPMGYWGKFAKENANKNLFKTALCWLCAVIFTYAILFGFGNLLLKNWNLFGINLIVAILGIAVFVRISKKIELFN